MSVSEKARALVAEYVSALLDDNTTRTVNLTSPRFLREQKARLELDHYIAALEAAVAAARGAVYVDAHESEHRDLDAALAALDASGGGDGGKDAG